MRQANSTSFVRVILALVAVMMIGGTGLALAGGDVTSYVPKSSILIGPGTVAPSGSASYVLEVTFTNGVVADYPPHTGASFSAVVGSISSGGAYTAPGSGTKDRLTGSVSQGGVTTTASKFIKIL